MKTHPYATLVCSTALPSLATLAALFVATPQAQAAAIDVNQTFNFTATTEAATTLIDWSALTWDNTPTWGAGVTAGIPNGAVTTSLARTYNVDVADLTLKQLQIYNADAITLQGGSITWDAGEAGVQAELGRNRHTMGAYAAGRNFSISTAFILNSDLRVTNWVENRITNYNSDTSGPGKLTLRIVPWAANNACALNIGGTAPNTHQGGTTITATGAITNATVNKAGAFGTGVLTLSGAGAVNLDLKNTSQVVVGLASEGTGAHTLKNSGTTAATLTLELRDGATTSYAKQITGDNLGLIVTPAADASGTGLQILGGENTYTGATSVLGATLLVNGSLATASIVTVAPGATLGGTGTINGATTVQGTIAPGSSVGTLSAGSDCYFAGDSALATEIDCLGSAQVETATAVGTPTADGNITVTVTGADIAGSPLVFTVPILAIDTTADWAGKVRAVLASDATITALYQAGGSAASIALTRITPAADDATLNIALASESADAGITAAPASTNTTLGRAPANDLLAVTGALDVSGATLKLAVTGTPTAPAYVIATYGTLTQPFVTFTGLPAGYIIDYAFNGNQIAIKQSSGSDTTPPLWADGWPLADTTTSSGFSARAKTNENGSAYYVVLANDASAAQVKAGQDSTGAVVSSKGTLTLTANTEAGSPVSGLAPNTSYDVWFVAEDGVPNLQASPVKVDVATLASLSPYAEWIGGFSVGSLSGPGDDPDADGKPNFLEFALNSDPATTTSQGKVFVKLATVGGTPNVLTLTVAVRSAAAAFAAEANNQKAVDATDSLSYLIEAANSLADWGNPLVTEVIDAGDLTTIQAGLPSPDPGWSYHSFRSDGDTATDPSDFIRVKVTSP